MRKAFFLLIFAAIFILTAGAVRAEDAAILQAKELAVQALTDRLSESDGELYIYKNFASSVNHYTQKAKIFGQFGDNVRDMDENWTEDAVSGSAIRCEQDTVLGDWGGWMFLNGYLPAGETVPLLNDGRTDDQGLDLSGAEELHFYAKGEQGGEKVEFFTAGFGYDQWMNKTVPWPDSAEKQSLGFITLTQEWKEYVIDLRDADMSYIICGFGFVLSGEKSGPRTNVFYLDEIRFIGGTRAEEESRSALLRSYDTDNIFIQHAAFTYDNALAAMAFISEDMPAEAARILDAFVYAVENDRYAPDRIRNAYASRSVEPFSGWEAGSRLPGWYDTEKGSWFEDQYQVGSNTGNTSYAALALLQYDARYGNETYLKTAQTLMDRVIADCGGNGDGFSGGYDGWPEADVVYPHTYKSIEHNIDAYAVFQQLYARTGEEKYAEAAASALRFIRSMYDPEEQYFYTGTLDDGITPNKGIVVLDGIVWNRMALGDLFEPYGDALDTVSGMRTAENGYPFSMGNGNGGWWPEGTAFTALMYKLEGEEETAAASLEALRRIQLESGMFPAASVPELPTGLFLFDGSPWVYADDPHVAPTAWYILAVNGFDPYSF